MTTFLALLLLIVFLIWEEHIQNVMVLISLISAGITLSLKEIINLNKPILCICLGMQELATLYQGTLYSIPNHHHKGYHKIIIKENTLLYKILKQKEILVNSRHHDAVKQTNLLVSSISQDNIIESIEVPNKTFALGLQWHPESIYTTNIYSRKIFSYFINACKSNK